MEIIDLSGYATRKHRTNIECDAQLAGVTDYRVDRGLMFTCGDERYDRHIDFDPFAYLRQLCRESVELPLEVLEGGCGEGWALQDLKNGVLRGVDRLKEYEGLGSLIRTTGVTLSMQHTTVAENLGIDSVYVGPLEACVSDKQYDFIYDNCGPVFHSPEEALPAYRRMLKPDHLAFVRLVSRPSMLVKEEIVGAIEAEGLEVVEIKGSNKYYDALLTTAA